MEFSACLFLRNSCFLGTYLLLNIYLVSYGFTDGSLVSSCATFGTCSQKCDMIGGEAKCSCVDMFQLSSDNKTCTPNDPYRQLIYATHHAIYSIRSNTDDFTDPPQQTQILNITDNIFRDVTSDVTNNFVYGTNTAGPYKEIFRINVNNSGEMETIVDVGTYMPNGIAFDWITGNVYFVDSELSYIAVCTPHLSQCAKIVDLASYGTSASRPSSIALHPNAGIMFWTDKGTHEAIKKASMDGSNPITIVSTGLLLPYGITVDEPSSRIYWVEAGLERIETTRFDGSDRHEIASSQFPVGIDIFGDTVYWTDWSDDQIKLINKFGGSESTISTGENPGGLTIMHTSKQPKLRTNPCENLQCSNICALSASTSRCLCPVGMIRNGSICSDDEKSPKLLVAQGNVLLITRINAIGRDVFEQVQLPPQIKAIRALVYNPINKSVIISDDISKNIVEYKMESQEYLILEQSDLMNVTCLEIDAVGENLFWYDAGKLTLEVMSMKTRARAILMRNIQNIYDILFISDHGTLYISQVGLTGAQEDIRKIVFREVQHVNDTSIRQFLGEDKPVKLAYQSHGDQVLGVFWNDSHVIVQSIGPELKYTLQSNYSVFDAVQFKSQMIWVDTTDKVKVRTTFSLHPNFVQTFKINFPTTGSSISSSFSRKILAAVETTSSSLERLRRIHPCSPVNWRRKACSHICLPTISSNTGVCWCPSHLELAVDGLNCIAPKNESKSNEEDLNERENKMESQTTNTTNLPVVISTTMNHSFVSGSRSSNGSVTVYVILPICLIITMIVVGVVIHLIRKRRENGASMLPRPFSSYDMM